MTVRRMRVWRINIYIFIVNYARQPQSVLRLAYRLGCMCMRLSHELYYPLTTTHVNNHRLVKQPYQYSKRFFLFCLMLSAGYSYDPADTPDGLVSKIILNLRQTVQRLCVRHTDIYSSFLLDGQGVAVMLPCVQNK